jgi:hypothetical protein
VIPKAFSALLLIASPALAQNAPLSEGPITCSSPVSPNDSAKSLIRRYGEEAVIQDNLYSGVEDITYSGVVLLPRAPDWRIEVSFTDETMDRVAGLTLPNTAKTSHWSVAGVTIGSSLAEVQKVNGKPFVLNEFETDAGGFVRNWNGGTLSRPLPGGCRVTVRFGKDGSAPYDLAGDASKISSDNKKLVMWAPVVIQIGVNFPEK